MGPTLKRLECRRANSWSRSYKGPSPRSYRFRRRRDCCSPLTCTLPRRLVSPFRAPSQSGRIAWWNDSRRGTRMHTRRKFFPRSSTMRRRLFWLLGGMSLGVIMIVNLAWLPGKISEIVETQGELQRIAVQGVRNQLQLFLEGKEQALRSQAMVWRSPFLEGNQEELRRLAHRFLQREPA